MATRKITITLDEAQLEAIRGLVENGTAASVSGFVQHAVGVALDDAAGWGALLAGAVHDSGGTMTAEERRWADQTLGVRPRRRTSAA
jgi:Arc/MetJ-type ribon-helix-helix transcriptional regulator